MGNGMINPVLQDQRVLGALRGRRILIDGEINDELALEVVGYMKKIYEDDCKRIRNNRPVKKEIELSIDSYGGSVLAGNSILNQMDFLKSKGYTITGVNQSKAISMAFDILINCQKRVGYFMSTYMLHQSQGGNPYQSLIKAERMLEFNKQQWEKSVDYYIKDTKLTREMLDDIYNNDKELWLDSDKALELGIIQKII